MNEFSKRFDLKELNLDSQPPYTLGTDLTVWQVGGIAPMQLISTPVQVPGKKLMHWQYVKLNHDLPGAVALAIDGDSIAIAKQWRLPLHKFTLEIPRGRAEVGETVEETAARELQEETGLSAKNVLPLGQIFPDTGTVSTPINVAVLSVEDTNGSGVNDGELSSWGWITFKQLDELIVRGYFTDGISLAALQLWRSSGSPRP